jgi:hypothetical protein
MTKLAKAKLVGAIAIMGFTTWETQGAGSPARVRRLPALV